MNSYFTRVAMGMLSAIFFAIPSYGVSAEAAEKQVAKAPQQLAIFSQTLNFNLPLDWKLAYSHQQGTMYSAEFVPASQALHTWSSMLCVQGFKDVAEDVSPQAFLETMAAVYFESCQGDTVLEDLPSEPLNDHETASAIIGCTKMPNSHLKSTKAISANEVATQGEIGHYIVVRGKQDLYLIHKSIRGEAFTKQNPPIQADNHQEFLSTITPLSLY
ncbi:MULTISPECIES: hypothetical protein [unclassified Shewanella]|uniref:hypothetical protein n=1 Tax=unclassified Shewanella TaxID=196818 RepID=UPI001BC50676|nr:MULTISPECIES: hypothetical protein [unclassified Shewanella]GIU04895.1 hypothetical protein TUM4444_00360 [Shewanella sp. MBTL60-112-B1]GIU24653.1 hypothetical protein TUM4445_02010 [Shewanella sp. MBTL60-112-B2]